MIYKVIIAVLVGFLLSGQMGVAAGDYALPYPGVLPDSPVWIAKDWRDRIVSWFIFDKEKKAKYYLFLADKRLAAGKMLSDFGQTDLGRKTFESADWFLKKAAADAESIGADKLLAQISLAANKNYEVTGKEDVVNWVRKLFERRLEKFASPSAAQK